MRQWYQIYVFIIMTTPWPCRAKRILQDNGTKLILSFYLSLLPSSCPSTYIGEIRKHNHISDSNPPETTDQTKMHHCLRHQYQLMTFLEIGACRPVPLRRECSIGMMHKLPSWLLVSSAPHYQTFSLLHPDVVLLSVLEADPLRLAYQLNYSTLEYYLDGDWMDCRRLEQSLQYESAGTNWRIR